MILETNEKCPSCGNNISLEYRDEWCSTDFMCDHCGCHGFYCSEQAEEFFEDE